VSNKPNFKGQTPPQPTSPKKPLWQSPIVWVLAVVGLALIVTVILSVGDDSTDDLTSNDALQTGFAEIIGNPLPELDEPDPALGQTAPAMSAQTFAGDRLQISNDGTARLYGFFAHWCGHCQNEITATVEWLSTNDLAPGVEIVAVSTAVEPTADNYPPSEWFAREQWTSTVIMDNGNSDLANGFGLTAFPFWVAVDADGNVAARTAGELTTQAFEDLLASITP
jgi:thiol-disulfide isomerase/thioredoxin